jgi:hypothetical protein
MSFKKFDLANDVASLVSYVNEVVAISGSIYTLDVNTKFYSNISSGSTDLGGYFQTIYDASPTSSLSTPLFDITYGYSTGSAYNVQATASSSLDEKIKIYRHFASALLGDPDAVFSVNSVDREEAFFLTIKRNIHKDELKKGSVGLTVNTVLAQSGLAQYTASDYGAVSSFKQNRGGEYAPLKISGSTGAEYGQVWYQAGVLVLPADLLFGKFTSFSGSKTLVELQYSGSINNLCDGFRKKTERLDFHNQTNLHSTVYFCRANNSEFNYSSNPTFIDDDKRIRVTSGSNILQTRTYITTVGLYDANDNLLAVGKVNKPIMKSPDTEAIFRLRLDY